MQISCFLVGALLLLLMPLLFEDGELVHSREVECWPSNGMPNTRYIPLKDGTVEQTFRAYYSGLEKIHIFFYNMSSEDNAKLCVSLEDKKGKSMGYWEEQTSNLGEETFCLTLYPEKKLIKNRAYTIKITLDGQESEISVCAIQKSAFHKSIGAMREKDEVQEKTTLYFVQGYVIQHYYMAMGALVLLVAFMFYLVTVLWPGTCIYLRWTIACAIPFISFAGIEILSGNWGATDASAVWKNILLLVLVLLLARSVLGRFADYALLVLAFVAGAVNYYVLLSRGSEFVFSDIAAFSTAMTVVENYELELAAPVYLVGVITLILLFTMAFLETKASRKQAIGERIVAAVPGVIVAVVFFGFILPEESISLYKISNSLRQKGWCYGNVCLLKVSSVSKPQGYSDEKVGTILENREKVSGNTTGIVPQNLIVIMNEALSDLSILGDLECNQDSLAYIHSLKDNTVIGNLHVPSFGGNTCNTEYEFLTGNSMHFVPGGVVPYMTLCKKTEPGFADVLKKQGYHTIAMHPYQGGNWKRDQVYKAMGFEEFLDISAYGDAEKIRNYISDKGNYERLIATYEKHREQNADERLFVFNVTMQNHGGYDKNAGNMEKTIVVNNVECETAEIYLSLVKESDDAFAYLIDYFSNVNEPTMIVMFGDHQPTLPTDFYDELNAISVSGANTQGANKRYKYVTPYIVWTNYTSDFEEIPDMSVNYLGSYVLQCAGLEMSEYQEFLLQFMEQYPVVGKYGVYDMNGGYTKYGEETAEWLKDYEYLQYLRIADRKSDYYSIFSAE